MSNHPTTPAPSPDDDAWERIARHVAGEDAPDERAALRAELDAHPERGALLAALAASTSAADAPLLPPDRVEAALQKVMRMRDEPAATPFAEPVAAPVVLRPAAAEETKVVPLRRPERGPRWFALRAAAAVLLLLGGAFLWRQVRPGAPMLAAAEYATGVGETEQVRLPDGSTVRLGPLSRLAVAADYGDARREMQLEGEAFITVTHDAARPFVVRTARAQVEDLGTAFVVHADSAGTDVVVTEGSVAVREGDDGGRRTVVHAGGRARVGRDGPVVTGAAPDAAQAAAWTEGRLVFRETPLGEMADAFRRWYGLTLVVDDPPLAARPVTATLPTASAAEALQVLSATAGARAVQRGDTVVLVPAR